MRNLIKKEGIILLALAVPFVAVAIFWSDFPDPMPVHFNIEGEADRFGSKPFGLFLLPGINLGLYILLVFIPRVDPQKINFSKFADTYRIIRVLIHSFLTFIFLLVAAASLGYNFNFPLIVMYAVAILILVFGNYMRTIRHNYFIGVRTPWTLANERVWTETHRFTASLWVSASLIMMICLPFVSKTQYLLYGYLLIIAALPIGYSYFVFQRVHKQNA